MTQIQIPNGTLATIANYSDQKLSEYNANPMIQALPPIFSDEEFIDRVTRMPDFSEEERYFDPQFRFHCVERLSRYFFPLNKTFELQRMIGVLLMQGYLARNPIEPEYARRANQIYEAIKTKSGKTIEEYVNVPTSASGFTLIGPSGMGKSTNFKNILNLYPQVIAHPEYSVYQLVWLKVDCPHAGSLKGLCIDVFKEIDRLLGTNYFKKFGSTRNSEDYMLAQVAQLAHTHHLGMLVIDEMQNLVNARRSKDDLLNFLVKMDNIIGVPVVRVGTNEAYPILQGNFRNARRGTGEGGVLWDRLDEATHIVVIRNYQEPDPFLKAAERQLEELNIQADIKLITKQDGTPKRKTIKVKQTLVGFGIEVTNLSDEDSIILQEKGLGGKQKMGCGVFV